MAVFLGESVPRFDVVMGLVGSTLTGPLMFIFPPLFFLKLCYTKKYLEENDPDFPMKAAVQHFIASRIQDGDDNELSNSFPLISRGGKDYRTFEFRDDICREKCISYEMRWFDVVLAGTVMVMGIGATIVTTYSSWSDAITSATFSQPCIVNATAAARSMIMDAMKL